MRSLKGSDHLLSDAHKQWEILEHPGDFTLVPFQQKLEQSHLYPLQPTSIRIFQVNIGKMCNQTCRHCHVDAGPDRKEIMSRETMQQCIDVLRKYPALGTVDITGGAPEMNPDFRWFVEAIKSLGRHVMVRCNLTIILANKKYHDLPQFYKQHRIEVVSSLPFYTKDRTDRQRGDGVFETSIRALQLLNEAGYGKEGSGLILNLVYNPAGAFLPPSQASLDHEYKQALREKYGIEFNNLFAITNLPISRYLDYLLTSGNYEKYMQKLVNAYNPAAAANVMCRNTISIGWDGYLYDCDFNQMLELKVDAAHNHVSVFSLEGLNDRNIVVGQHCYGCTAGAGSSCGGAVA
ncbi:MAG TPA: arsenosugar biosynthesis radical SAM (seleno)protein ArsS [Chitinophagaceae bacterium]|nr:arsenosugar biosynthesis radical SAM (seleno)protein ArsS [Chitinophagaceae bacterium]